MGVPPINLRVEGSPTVLGLEKRGGGRCYCRYVVPKESQGFVISAIFSKGSWPGNLMNPKLKKSGEG